MSKVSLSPTNAFCPQSLYLYGTYKKDGTPDYGLFCWATYCWDEGLRFVACIGEDKLTRDRIRETGVFSASIVSESLLPAADFCGNNSGYTCDKSGIIRSEKGAVLEVPVPESSPWTFELEVDKTLHLDDTRTSEIYVCRIRNLRADERLADIIREEFDLRPLAIIEKLGLRRPIYEQTAVYGHFGKAGLPWEQTDRAAELKNKYLHA